MPTDDRLKKYQEAGADFLETARSRAEEFLSELAKAGEGTQSRAQGAIDDLVEGSRRGTEQLLGLIRREVTSQLNVLGFATKRDLSRLEQRLKSGRSKAAPSKAAAKKTAAKKAPAKKTAAKKTAAKKTAARKAAATKKA